MFLSRPGEWLVTCKNTLRKIYMTYDFDNFSNQLSPEMAHSSLVKKCFIYHFDI